MLQQSTQALVLGALFADTDLNEELNLVRLNVEGTVHLAKERLLKQTLAEGQGRVLFTASDNR